MQSWKPHWIDFNLYLDCICRYFYRRTPIQSDGEIHKYLYPTTNNFIICSASPDQILAHFLQSIVYAVMTGQFAVDLIQRFAHSGLLFLHFITVLQGFIVQNFAATSNLKASVRCCCLLAKHNALQLSFYVMFMESILAYLNAQLFCFVQMSIISYSTYLQTFNHAAAAGWSNASPQWFAYTILHLNNHIFEESPNINSNLFEKSQRSVCKKCYVYFLLSDENRLIFMLILW